MLHKWIAITLSSLAFASTASAQTTWFVDATATPPGSGTSSSPYASIQFAIAQPSTVAGDTVLVLPGTYVEQLDFLGKAITVESQQGAAVTIVDANQVGSVVTFASLEGRSSVLRGFTLTNGIGTTDPTFSFNDGGGVYCSVASPTIVDCDIVGNGPNFSADRGGGVYVEAGSPVFRGCRVAGNQVSTLSGRGGGLYVVNSLLVTLEDCELDQNFSIDGGALYSSTAAIDMIGGQVVGNTGLFEAGGLRAVGASNLTLTGVRLEDNFSGEGTGGAIYFAGNTLTMDACDVIDNAVDNDHRGGGVFVESGTATITGGEFALNFSARGGAISVATGVTATLAEIVFRENTARSFQAFDGAGGAVHVEAGAAVTATRCAFLDNCAIEGPGQSALGGGLFGPVLVDRCTFVGNTASVDGGAVAGATVSNSILWANALANGTPNQLSPGTIVTWSDVEGGALGTGNIASDPLFWSLFGRDVRLTAASPAIDAGDPGAALDPDGSRADMGAYPFDPAWVSPPFTYCFGKTNSVGCVPFVASTGAPSASSSSAFDVRAEDVVPGEAGVLLYSFRKSNLDFHGGKLCVKTPFVRTPPKAAKNVAGGCSNWRVTRNVQQTIQNGSNPLLTAGQTVYAQWRQRDPADPAGFGDGFSDGLRFVIAP